MFVNGPRFGGFPVKTPPAWGSSFKTKWNYVLRRGRMADTAPRARTIVRIGLPGIHRASLSP
jgi:hypothetical protein